jgi:hypothetical protein
MPKNMAPQKNLTAAAVARGTCARASLAPTMPPGSIAPPRPRAPCTTASVRGRMHSRGVIPHGRSLSVCGARAQCRVLARAGWPCQGLDRRVHPPEPRDSPFCARAHSFRALTIPSAPSLRPPPSLRRCAENRQLRRALLLEKRTVHKFCELTDKLTVGQARIEELQRKHEGDLKAYKEMCKEQSAAQIKALNDQNDHVVAENKELRKDVKVLKEKITILEQEYTKACEQFSEAVGLNDKLVAQNGALLNDVTVLEEKAEILKHQHLEAMRTEQSRLKKEINTLCEEKEVLVQAKSRLEACNEGLYAENQRLVRNEAVRMEMQVPQIIEVAAQNLAAQALQAALDEVRVMQQQEPETIPFEQDDIQDIDSDEGCTTIDCYESSESESDESDTDEPVAQAPAASG